MCDQATADRGDEIAMLLGLRFENQVAFAVGAHRPIVQIGRADPQDPVIDDHELGVHHHGGFLLSAPGDRTDEADAIGQHRDAAHWIQALNQGGTIDADDAVWRPHTTACAALDPRVLAAAEQVDARLFENQPVSDVAKSVALSESRLQHLFASQTGLRLRQYRLWMRVLKTAGDAALGHSMTDAAHANGFSSSAHFSSSFRKSFGLAPSEILNSNP